MKLDFVRGHMGGNTIVLLHGDQFPPGRELELAVKILGPNYLAGHEAALLYPASCEADLAVKIAETTGSSFISACGGMTQVLGKALIETGLGSSFGIRAQAPVTEIVLETGAGPTRIMVETSGQKAMRINTDMGAFARECYDKGVELMELQGTPVIHAGKFMALNGDQVKKVHPRADFQAWDDATRNLLAVMQAEFMRLTGETEYNCVLYDWNPALSGDLRVVYPHCIPQNCFEPSCGTGTVAAGIALLASGELAANKDISGGRVILRFEAGGSIELGGPDITEITLTLEAGKVTGAVFSHSLVEITSQGEVIIES